MASFDFNATDDTIVEHAKFLLVGSAQAHTFFRQMFRLRRVNTMTDEDFKALIAISSFVEWARFEYSKKVPDLYTLCMSTRTTNLTQYAKYPLCKERVEMISDTIIDAATAKIMSPPTFPESTDKSLFTPATWMALARAAKSNATSKHFIERYGMVITNNSAMATQNFGFYRSFLNRIRNAMKSPITLTTFKSSRPAGGR